MTYLLIFFVSFISTLFFTPYLISFLKKNLYSDIQNATVTPKEVNPHMGGLIIYLVVLVIINSFIVDFTSIKYLLISLTILTFSGIIDDVLGLNKFIKFILQNASVVILILYLQQNYSSVSIFGVQLKNPYDYFVLLVFILFAINSISQFDNLDGFATKYAIQIFIVLLALAVTLNDNLLIIISVGLLGSSVGFLKFNSYPASVKLGNTGSGVIGFFLIALSLLSMNNFNKENMDLSFSIVLLGFPLMYSAKSYYLRFLNLKEGGESENVIQQDLLLKDTISPKATIFIYEILSLLFIFASLLYLKSLKNQSIILFIFVSLLMFLLKPALEKTNLAGAVNSFISNLRDIPIKNLQKIVKFIFSISLLIILIICIVSFATKTSLSLIELSYLLLLTLGLLGLSIYQFKKSESGNELNVFLNFTIFFIISKLSLPSIFTDQFTIDSITQVHDISFSIITTLIVIMLIYRWKMLRTKKLILTGTDLTIIIIITLTFIINNFFQFDLNYFLSVSLLEAFIFYVWYKLAVDFFNNSKFVLTILSFILPISLIITLIVSDLFN